MSTSNQKLEKWVSDIAKMTNPDSIYWFDGTHDE